MPQAGAVQRDGWATGQQLELLRSLQPEYDVAKAKKDYSSFWPKLFNTYLAQFPLVEELFPGKSLEALDQAQSEEYVTKLQKLQARLKEWFRWRANVRSRNANNTVSSKDLKRIYHTDRTREAKAYEMFAELFPDIVRPAYEKACNEKGLAGRQKLPEWHRTAKGLWSNATDEQKEAVSAKLVRVAVHSEDLDKMVDGKVEDSPETFQHFQDIFPNVLGAVLEPACRKAGLMAIVTLVGPVPKMGGRIQTTSSVLSLVLRSFSTHRLRCHLHFSLQFGDNKDTPLFCEGWSGHDSVYLEALGSFAKKHVFSEELCLSRSLLKQEENADDGGQSSSAPGRGSSTNADDSPKDPVTEQGAEDDVQEQGAQLATQSAQVGSQTPRDPSDRSSIPAPPPNPVPPPGSISTPPVPFHVSTPSPLPPPAPEKPFGTAIVPKYNPSRCHGGGWARYNRASYSPPSTSAKETIRHTHQFPQSTLLDSGFSKSHVNDPVSSDLSAQTPSNAGVQLQLHTSTPQPQTDGSLFGSTEYGFSKSIDSMFGGENEEEFAWANLDALELAGKALDYDGTLDVDFGSASAHPNSPPSSEILRKSYPPFSLAPLHLTSLKRTPQVKILVSPALELSPEEELAAISSFIASLPQNVIPPTVDPVQPIDPQLVLDFDTRSSRATDEVRHMVDDVWSRNPVFVYSKLYSPVSRELKTILANLYLKPAPTIVDVDMRDDADVLKPVLSRLTGSDELPILLIGGKVFSSMDEIREMAKDERLAQLVSEAGAMVNGAKKKKGKK
ncbi:hypothetical protein NMY22_g14673 [Coprinellus aureogranulatus]|nr:hypothetical protein NMY22_g14673 [Coprinellus aureogranulatus]